MYVLVVGSYTSYTRYQGRTSFMCYILVVRTSCVEELYVLQASNSGG